MGNGGLVQASVVCYHCGHASGFVEAEASRPFATGAFVPIGRSVVRIPINGRRITCGRCSGPTYLDEVRRIVKREPQLVTWRGRGRPPKNAIRIALPPEEGVKRRRPVVLYALMIDENPSTQSLLPVRQAV